MGEAFTIQISTSLINRLTQDGDKSKKKTRKLKPKLPQESHHQVQSNQKNLQQHADGGHMSSTAPASLWPLPQPFLPVTPSSQHVKPELEAIQATLRESERVVDRLEKHEEDMLKQVTQRAKELHEKEFKLPNHRPMACLSEKDACLACYKENLKDPLKCADAVRSFQNCARRVRQEKRS